MNIESRFKDLSAINNNIEVECDKIIENLRKLKEKSAIAITSFNSLNTPNKLRKYSSTYEYLNKFYIKVLEQNCLLELFFLELDDLFFKVDDHIVHTNENFTHESVDVTKKDPTTNELCSPCDSNISQKLATVENSTVNITEINENTTEISVHNCIPETTLSVSNKNNLSTKDSTSKISYVSAESSESSESYETKSTSYSCQEMYEPNETSESTSDSKSESSENMVNITRTLSQVKEKIKQKELQHRVQIPDLRPTAFKTLLPKKFTQPKKSNSKLVKNVDNNKGVTNNILVYEEIVLKTGIPPKENELCYISFVESPSSFYIQVVREDNTSLDYMSEQIAEVSTSLRKFSDKLDARRSIQNYCVACIEDSSWHRVSIVNWMMEDKSTVEVRLLDHGHICKIPFQSLRQANQFFFSLPIMAEKCQLAWVKPVDGSKSWSENSIQHFQKVTSNQLFTISYVEKEGNNLIIDLQHNDCYSIAGLMIQDGKAKDVESDDSFNNNWSNEFMKKQIFKSQGFNENDFKKSRDEILETLLQNNDDDDEVTDPNIAVSHYDAKDEQNICRFFLKSGSCFKGKNCSFSHIPLNPDGWTTDRENVYFDAFKQNLLPTSGAEIVVKIVHIIDLRSFYVVVKNLPDVTDIIETSIANIRSLVRVMNDPQEVKKYKPLKVLPALGEIILVKYNDKWQRARVVALEEFANKVEVEVFLVDFGFTIRVNMKNCMYISEQYLHLPFQVVMCTLCNVSMKENMTEDENDMGSDYLEINVQNKKLKATVRHSSNYLSVNLYTENGKDVGEELIKAGIVHRCPINLCINSQNGLLVD